MSMRLLFHLVPHIQPPKIRRPLLLRVIRKTQVPVVIDQYPLTRNVLDLRAVAAHGFATPQGYVRVQVREIDVLLGLCAVDTRVELYRFFPNAAFI